MFLPIVAIQWQNYPNPPTPPNIAAPKMPPLSDKMCVIFVYLQH